MTVQIQIQNLLRQKLISAKEKNPSYSLRALSQQIGCNPSSISEILNNKREITQRMGRRILEGLSISPEKAALMIEKLPKKNTKKNNPEKSEFIQLSVDHFQVISNWYYFAILSLAETEEFNHSPKYIAKRLGISIQKVKIAIDCLVRLNLLERKNNKILTTGKQFTTSMDRKEPAIQQGHLDNLELIRSTFHTAKYELRDFSSITMTFDPGEIHKAKKMIQDFRRKFCNEMESHSKKEVYKLNIQLIPLTKQ